MFSILSENYQFKKNKPIIFAELGNCTNNFAFFVGNTIVETMASTVLGKELVLLKKFFQEIEKYQNEEEIKANELMEKMSELVEESDFQ